MGMALNLEEETVGAVILGDYTAIKEGDQVKTTGRVVEVPGRRGAARPGRRPARRAARRQGRHRRRTKTRPVERIAPGVIVRQPVDTPVQTGIKAIDAMIPIGRGQRELIIGDRQTGKTAIAIDTIINQKGERPRSASTSPSARSCRRWRRPWRTLEKYGAMEHTIVVVAGAEDPAPLQYLAPYAGVAMGEEFMENGVEIDGRLQGRAVRLRRPVEARLGVPPDVAAAAPPARPRGVPGRRLLPPQPPARARRAPERGERRRLADRAADHRDAGRRRVGLHPDQRDLDHRRPDLPRDRPVQRRPAARAERRHLGVARGLGRPDQGDEEGRRPAQAGPRPVPRAGGVRPVRVATWTRPPATS